MGAILDSLQTPHDLRKLDPSQLPALCLELRELISETTVQNGGHLATNLGAVEATVALHHSYDFSVDRLIFDVGHQCYAHKLLTGRKDQFKTLRTGGGLSGYPNPAESCYDPYVSGHASTAISVAAGYAQAFSIQKLDRRVVAFVGDGSLTGGEAYEGLCYLGDTQRDVLVVLNDNRMAISKCTGGLTRYLDSLRTSPEYNELKRDIISRLKGFPVFADQLYRIAEGIHGNLYRMMIENGIFSALGYKYFGPYDGHDVVALTRVLQQVARLKRPVLLHILTSKGKGNATAECDPVTWHGVSPATKVPPQPGVSKVTYTDAFSESLSSIGEVDKSVVAFTAAMATGTGVCRFMEVFKDRAFDVGIAEQHCVTMATAMSKGGLKPVVAIYSTFMQRAVDQVFHDALLQRDVAMLLAMDRAGLVGEDGPTHHGLYDIGMLRSFPGIVLCSPMDAHEMALMMKWALDTGKVVGMRYPRDVIPAFPEVANVEPIQLGKGVQLREGKDAAILAYGNMVRVALDAAKLLEKQGVNVSVANARFARPVDSKLVEAAASTGLVVTIEEHAVEGGFGSLVADAMPTGARLVKLGVPDEFIEHGARAVLLKKCGLDAESVANRLKAELGR